MGKEPLFRQHEIKEGVTLFHRRSSKWKTEVLRVVFCQPVDDHMADRALAAQVLRHGHRGLAGMEKVSARLQDLYGAHYAPYVSKTTRFNLLVFRAAVAAPEFLPRNLDPLAKMVEIIGNSLERPLTRGDGLSPDIFDRERTQLLQTIDSVMENKPQYADMRLVQEMFGTHSHAIPVTGRRSEVLAASPASSLAAYRKTVAHAPVMIFVISPRSTTEVKRILRRALPLEPRRGFRVPRLALPAPRGRARTVVEEDDLNQSRVSMAFRVADYHRVRDAFAGGLADMIFGGDSSSRLFKVVREKHSLAYSVGSTFEGASGIVYVSAGIDGQNFDKVRRMVQKEVKAIAAGRFDAEEIEVARANLNRGIHSALDSQEGLINFVLGQKLTGRNEKSPDDLISSYQRVTSPKMADVFSRLRLDTVFFLAQKGTGS